MRRSTFRRDCSSGPAAQIEGSGTLTNAQTGFITAAPPSGDQTDLGCILENLGTIDQTTAGTFGFVQGTVNNAAGGLFDLQADASFADFGVDGTGTIVNDGTFEKSGGSGTSDFFSPPGLDSGVGFAGSGTIDVESGTLELNTSTSLTVGTFDVGTGAVLALTGNETFTGTYTGSGGGQVQLKSGEIGVGAAGATFNFPAGMFQWQGGIINRLPGGGTFTNAGFMTLTGEDDTNGPFVNTGTMTVTNSTLGLQLEAGEGSLVNSGTLIVTSTGEVQPLAPASGGNGFITNLAGGTIQLQGGGQIGFGNIAGPLTNQGLVQVTGGSGTATINTSAFNSTGTVEVDSGALAFTSRVEVTQVSGTTLAAGTWEALDGSTIQFPAGTNLTTNQANVTLSGAGATIPALANLATNAGTFSVLAGATFTAAGNLSNTGTVTVGPASTLAVKGSYAQSSAGTLEIQLGGTPASGQFGQLAVGGSAALAGTLQPELVDGFGPFRRQ